MSDTAFWIYDGVLNNKESVEILLANWNSWRQTLKDMPGHSNTRSSFIEFYDADIDFLERYGVSNE